MCAISTSLPTDDYSSCYRPHTYKAKPKIGPLIPPPAGSKSSVKYAARQVQCLQSIPLGNLALIVKTRPSVMLYFARREYLQTDLHYATKPQWLTQWYHCGIIKPGLNKSIPRLLFFILKPWTGSSSQKVLIGLITACSQFPIQPFRRQMEPATST